MVSESAEWVNDREYRLAKSDFHPGKTGFSIFIKQLSAHPVLLSGIELMKWMKKISVSLNHNEP